jgi:hypothetical protein
MKQHEGFMYIGCTVMPPIIGLIINQGFDLWACESCGTVTLSPPEHLCVPELEWPNDQRMD